MQNLSSQSASRQTQIKLPNSLEQKNIENKQQLNYVILKNPIVQRRKQSSSSPQNNDQ